MSRIPLVGADPEFFVMQGNRVISGHIFKCGTKLLPMATKHGHVQVDGLALEANVPPAESKEQFIANVLGVIGDLNEIVAKNKCHVVAAPWADFPKKYLRGLPPEVRELGCNPDFNAYSLGMNDSPCAAVNFRTTAGHIHVGWTKDKPLDNFPHFEACAALARQMDYFVGLRTLKFDKDNKRRELYGQAGAFRPKSYGMEYRVPSSVWTTSEALMGQVYDATVSAFETLNEGRDFDKEFDGFAQTCISKNIRNWEELSPDVAKGINYGTASVS